MKSSKQETIANKLGKNHINYFSDLFIIAMVLCWLFVVIVMTAFAIYSTICYCDNDIWSNVTECVTIPLSCGGAIWMIKNSVQHAIANNKGERAHMDFPAVNADDEDAGMEKIYTFGSETDEEMEDAKG